MDTKNRRAWNLGRAVHKVMNVCPKGQSVAMSSDGCHPRHDTLNNYRSQVFVQVRELQMIACVVLIFFRLPHAPLPLLISYIQHSRCIVSRHIATQMTCIPLSTKAPFLGFRSPYKLVRYPCKLPKRVERGKRSKTRITCRTRATPPEAQLEAKYRNIHNAKMALNTPHLCLRVGGGGGPHI